jgi:hypothetical protein
MKINLWKKMFLVVMTTMIVLPACDDDDDDVSTGQTRLFRPVELTTSFDGTTVEISWLPILGAASYNLDLSRDSLKFDNIVESYTGIEEAVLVIPDLIGGERYSVRIMAVAEDPSRNSEYAELTFVTPTENILYQLEGDDVGANDVILSWDPVKAVTHIVITPVEGGESIEFQLDEADQSAGEKFCDGLTGETEYVAEIYNGEAKRGSITFKTLIDIGDATLIKQGDDLIAIINDAGSGTFVVEGGEYKLSSDEIELSGSTTIKALNAADKPLIYGAAIYINANGSYILEDLDFTGYTITETGEVNTEELMGYATRVTTSDVTEGELIIRNCSFRNYERSLLRGTEGGALDKVEFDNVIVENVTSGGNEFIDLRTCAVSEISITNSTMFNSSQTRHFLRCDDIAGFTGQVVNIENSTFHNVAMPANRFLYIRVVDSKATVKNCVFSEMGVFDGTAWTGAEFRVDTPAAGFPVIDYNYYYMSGVLAASEFNGPNCITDESGVSPFADPENGDFTVDINSDIRTMGENNGPMGDPRWVN